MLNHPDVILNIWREPHKKLVERISRDFTVHGCVPFYQVGEVRIRGFETVEHAKRPVAVFEPVDPSRRSAIFSDDWLR